MAKEYIERDVAIEKTEAFCDVFVTQWTDEKVLAWIRNLPAADVVEVVRCKECVYAHNNSFSACYDSVVCAKCSGAKAVFFPVDHFCAFGERRDT